jgi:hypothetical protein
MTQTASSPYQFEVHSFSGDLGTLVEGLYKSKHGFILKSLAVEPAPEAPAAQGQPGQLHRPIAPTRPPPGAKPGRPEPLKTILNEKLLKATLLVEVVKPLK